MERLETKSPEWIKNMIDFMENIDKELADAGERVASEGLVDPSEARTVRFENGAPVPTDGPFAEAKESLAGYWIIDASEERALEIASRVVDSSMLARTPYRKRCSPHGD
jgi:hypothetical protein